MSVYDKRGRVPSKPSGDPANASPRPWTVKHVTRLREAVIHAADGTVVAVCHADNAEMIVAAVNAADAEMRGVVADVKMREARKAVAV